MRSACTSLVFLLLAIVPIGCSQPVEHEEDDGDVTLDGLTGEDVERAASRALARANAAGTDFESAESGPATAAPSDAEIHPASTLSGLDRALGAGTWAYAFRITKDGRTSTELASANASRSMWAASVFKVVTGYTAFANQTVAPDTLTFTLRTSNNALANFSMCKNGEKLGRYTADCKAVAYAPATMKMGAAIAASKEWLRGRGVELSTSFVMKDGSGLLPDDHMTVDDIVSVLMAARRDPGYATFREMLAQPGKASTLRSRFAGLEGKLFAKTGTYPSTGAGTKTLAGFVDLGRGRTMVFAVFGNGVGAVSPAMGRIESAVRIAIRAADSAAD